MARLADFLFGIIKWPVAVLMVLSLPALIEAFFYFPFRNIKFLVFFAGMFSYLAIKILAGSRASVFMQVLAHELTHIVFAWLTFHKVVHIHFNPDESGGAMAFKGKGNWLITISPYFFPLFLFIFMMFVTFFREKIPDSLWVNGVFGYFFAYHLESIFVQIHGEQPDFKEVGFLFCFMFLPGANLFACLMIAAFNNGGWQFVEIYSKFIYQLDVKNISAVLSYFTT